MESTDIILTINGVPARLWRGTTERGIPFTALITRVGVDVDADRAEFERDLNSTPTPRPEDVPWPLRMIL